MEVRGHQLKPEGGHEYYKHLSRRSQREEVNKSSLDHFQNCSWLVLSDEQMSKRWQFSLLNDEQMSNKVGVKHQPGRGEHFEIQTY